MHKSYEKIYSTLPHEVKMSLAQIEVFVSDKSKDVNKHDSVVLGSLNRNIISEAFKIVEFFRADSKAVPSGVAKFLSSVLSDIDSEKMEKANMHSSLFAIDAYRLSPKEVLQEIKDMCFDHENKDKFKKACFETTALGRLKTKTAQLFKSKKEATDETANQAQNNNKS